MVVKYKNNNIEFEIEGSIDEVKEIYSLIQSITIDNSTKESTDKDVLNEQEKKNYTKKCPATSSSSSIFISANANLKELTKLSLL